MRSTLSHRPHIPRFARADGERWESFGNTFPKRLWFKKIKYPLKYCRLTCNWADGATHRSYPHMVLLTMQTRTKGFAPSPTRSLSKYGDISARIAPTCNLTNLYNYFQRSAYVRSPVSGLALRLSLRCTSDTYSLHMHRISSFKKGRTEVDKARPLGAYLMI